MLPSSALRLEALQLCPAHEHGLYCCVRYRAGDIRAFYVRIFAAAERLGKGQAVLHLFNGAVRRAWKRILPLMGISSSASLKDSCRGRVKSAVEKAVSSMTTFMSRE